MGIKILLVDNHGLIRQRLFSLLDQQPDIEVVGEAENGQEAINLVCDLRPDLVITDVSMPNINGIEATRKIIHLHPQVKVIALSGHPHESFVISMLRAGASAYVLKDCLFDELLEAIQAVTRGECYLSSKVTSAVVSNCIRLISKEDNSPLNTLSQREKEVLQLITEGKQTKQIALQLNESTKAIKLKRLKIMEKLHNYSIAELAKFAIVGGLTYLES